MPIARRTLERLFLDRCGFRAAAVGSRPWRCTWVYSRSGQ